MEPEIQPKDNAKIVIHSAGLVDGFLVLSYEYEFAYKCTEFYHG